MHRGVAACIRPGTCTLVRVSSIRRYIPARARVRLNMFIRAARVKSVRINWQTLNSLRVCESPCAHATSDETLLQVGKNASD